VMRLPVTPTTPHVRRGSWGNGSPFVRFNQPGFERPLAAPNGAGMRWVAAGLFMCSMLLLATDVYLSRPLPRTYVQMAWAVDHPTVYVLSSEHLPGDGHSLRKRADSLHVSESAARSAVKLRLSRGLGALPTDDDEAASAAVRQAFGKASSSVLNSSAGISDDISAGPVLNTRGSVVSGRYGTACRGFFTVFATAFLSPSIADHDHVGHVMRPQLEYWSAQMAAYDRKLTLFVTNDEVAVGLAYSNIRVQQFDAHELLGTCGFGADHLAEIKRWQADARGHAVARIADVLRLCLAKRHQMTYVDFDVMLIDATPDRFERPFVPAGLWIDQRSTLEVSNCIFCLNAGQLDAAVRHVQNVLERKLRLREQYFYTELGPIALARMVLRPEVSVLNPVELLPEQHPFGFTVEEMARLACRFNMSHFHLTGAIRSRLHIVGDLSGRGRIASSSVRYAALVQTLRCATGAPDLKLGEAGPLATYAPHHADTLESAPSKTTVPADSSASSTRPTGGVCGCNVFYPPLP
jgi:hypothetical protein